MKIVIVNIRLSIDEIGRVKVDQVDYITQGRSDQTLFEGKTEAADLNTSEEVQPGLRLTPQAPTTEILAMLATLGLTDAEINDYASRKSEKRIRDVANWIKHKNGVASPAGLARKLFAIG